MRAADPPRHCQTGDVRIRVWKGDITPLDVDAIVNAANGSLQRGGGVCGAIFKAAGRDLDVACDAIGSCDTGDAVATPGFGLRSKWVIHTVGPVWRGGDRGEVDRLASCYRRVLDVADDIGARSVAIPAISTGIYGFPAEHAASIAVSTLTSEPSPGIDEVVLVAFDEGTKQRYEQLLGDLKRSHPSNHPEYSQIDLN